MHHPFVPDQSKQTEELLRLWIESYSPSKRFYFLSSKLSKIIKENPFFKVSCLIHLSKLLGHTQTIPTQKHLFNRWRQHTGNLKMQRVDPKKPLSIHNLQGDNHRILLQTLQRKNLFIKCLPFFSTWSKVRLFPKSPPKQRSWL